MFDPSVVGGEAPVDGAAPVLRAPGEQAVGDKQLVAVVTFLGDPTVAEAQYLDATPTP